MAEINHVAVIGGGIIGLAVARELVVRGMRVTVCEKESGWAAHQSGHNSNVAHAGLYYRPGSFKARMSVAGNRSIVAYAREHGVPVDVCGKLVVATREAELNALYELSDRAEANGVPAKLVEPEQAREYEPEVVCVKALRVESTAAIDFGAVCQAFVEELMDAGADLQLDTEVVGIHRRAFGGVEVRTTQDTVIADALINCAGLQADRIARLAGLTPSAQIVPFRGEYYELVPSRRELVRGLIYPVPDPTLPFLGVHLTRMLDGSVHAGPNAVLALSREGYGWRKFSARDVADAATNAGLWRLAWRYPRTSWDEVTRSLSRRKFALSLAELVPAIERDDIVRCGSGVRAQAIRSDGSLVDDFLIEHARCQVHVLNAPSPAATCALEIARHLVKVLRTVS